MYHEPGSQVKNRDLTRGFSSLSNSSLDKSTGAMKPCALPNDRPPPTCLIEVFWGAGSPAKLLLVAVLP
jgi:hypothetical protein